MVDIQVINGSKARQEKGCMELKLLCSFIIFAQCANIQKTLTTGGQRDCLPQTRKQYYETKCSSRLAISVPEENRPYIFSTPLTYNCSKATRWIDNKEKHLEGNPEFPLVQSRHQLRTISSRCQIDHVLH